MSRYADSDDDDDVLAAMERAAFAPHRFEIPVGEGLPLHGIRYNQCACCGGQATRTVYDLKAGRRRLLCAACR